MKNMKIICDFKIFKNLAPFDRLEIGNFTLIGPLDEEDLRELTGALKFGIQRRIRLIRLENVMETNLL
jgi:hypothetical protein